MTDQIRINKRLAELGLCSRREGDALIEAKQVLVNGQPAVLGQKVSEVDTIEIKGKTKELMYLAYYKGRGVITHSPEGSEVDIATKIKNDYQLENVYPVGRLDKDSEGLLILTNDGRVTAPLLAPEAHTAKVYDVIVDKDFNNAFLKEMASGVNIEGYQTKPADITPSSRGSKRRFLLTITEGKKHQIRRMCAALGYQIESLKRIQVLNITLGDLKPNQFRYIKGAELAEFLQQLHIK